MKIAESFYATYTESGRYMICPIYTDLKHINVILLRGRMLCHTPEGYKKRSETLK